MEVIAAIIGVVDVTIRTSSKIWGLCNAWRDAPSNLYQLRDDLTRTELFFTETREGLISYPRTGLNEKFILGDLKRLLDQGALVIQQIENIVDQLWEGGDSGESELLNARRKLAWLRHSAKISKSRRELAAVVSAVCRLLILQNVTVSNELRASIDNSYDGLRSHLGSSLEKTTRHISEAVTSSEQRILSGIDRQLDVLAVKLRTTTIGPPEQSYRDHSSLIVGSSPLPSNGPPCQSLVNPGPRCSVDCRCRCHFVDSFSMWELTSLHALVGSVFLIYSGNPTRSCTQSSCWNNRNRYTAQQLRLMYAFPDWLARAAVYVFFSSNLGGSPKMEIRILHRFPKSFFNGSRNMFRLLDQGDEVEEAKDLLVERQASVYDVREGVPLLFWALNMRRVGVIKVLLQAGADPYQVMDSMTQAQKPTPAQKAMELILAGDATGKELSEVFPISRYIEYFDYPMLHRVAMGYLRVDLSEIIKDPQYASSINHKAADGLSPIELAAIRGDTRMTKLLLRAGVDPGSDTALDALRQACRYGHYGTVKALLEAGVPARPGRGYTPYLLAARSVSDDERILPLLSEYGGGIGFQDEYAQYALCCSVIVGNMCVTRYLLENGSDPSQQDDEGDNSLSSAIMYSQPGITRLLLDHGVETTHVSSNGRNILHHLAASGNAELMEIFAKAGLRGVSTLAKDHLGKTPLQVLNTETRATPTLRKAFEAVLDATEGLAGDDEEELEDEDEEFFDALEDTTTV